MDVDDDDDVDVDVDVDADDDVDADGDADGGRGRGEGSFIVSDTEDMLTAEQHAEVDTELARIRQARADIDGLYVVYLRGLPQARVHSRLMAQAFVATGGVAWQPRLTSLLEHCDLSFHDTTPSAYGHCAACNRPRWLSKMIVSPVAGTVLLGQTCGVRALAVHTLHHARAKSSTMLRANSLSQVRAEMRAVEALIAVLGAADDLAGTDDAPGKRNEDVAHTLQLSRAMLGFVDVDV